MANTFLFQNLAQTTLAAPINTTATSITLATGTGALFPSPTSGQQFAVDLNDAATGNIHEIVYCASITGDVMTVIRAREGTVALNWLAGDFAANKVTAGALTAFSQTGSLSNVNVYQIVGGVQQVSVNGAAYTTTGASGFTYTASGAAQVELRAGGASGGSTGSTTNQSAAGGGQGGRIFSVITGQTPGSTAAITVGLGGVAPIGSGSSNGNNGNNGGATSFGALTAGGGQGGGGAGTQTPGAAGGAGGTATGGTINEVGGPGMDGGNGIGGTGGGNGGGVGRTTATTNLDATGLGAGGGGSYNATGVRGGAGANGFVIVRY